LVTVHEALHATLGDTTAHRGATEAALRRLVGQCRGVHEGERCPTVAP
jgi:hypothetical protein